MDLSINTVLPVALLIAALISRSMYRRALGELNGSELNRLQEKIRPLQKVQYAILFVFLIIVLIPETPLLQKQSSFETMRLYALLIGLLLVVAGAAAGLPYLFFRLQREQLPTRFSRIYLFDRAVILGLLGSLLFIIYRDLFLNLI